MSWGERRKRLEEASRRAAEAEGELEIRPREMWGIARKVHKGWELDLHHIRYRRRWVLDAYCGGATDRTRWNREKAKGRVKLVKLRVSVVQATTEEQGID